ncbi:MAG: sigma-70 family RNA polymerase sigma factor [Acidobacteria bacterium]|nr:sigma-70 family RNA polymerase sigma factor [Acidobacteriota bacterium]
MAFSGTLWDKVRSGVRHRLGRRIRNTFDADDLTQDSMLVAFQKSNGIEDEHSLELYSQKIGRLQAANYARRQKSAAQRCSPTAVESVAEHGVPPEDYYTYRELVTILMDFAAGLRSKDRILLKLLLRGASGEEICEVLRVTPPARNLLAFRLRRKLRLVLVGKGYMVDDAYAKD